jgi:hypothetical protein
MQASHQSLASLKKNSIKQHMRHEQKGICQTNLYKFVASMNNKSSNHRKASLVYRIEVCKVFLTEGLPFNLLTEKEKMRVYDNFLNAIDL